MIDNSKIIADTGTLEQLTEEDRRMLKNRGNRLGESDRSHVVL